MVSWTLLPRLLCLCLLSACASSPHPVSRASASLADFDVVWVGDILLGDAAQDRLNRDGYLFPFEHLQGVMQADYLVGNAEGPLTTRDKPFFPDAKFHYNVQPEAAVALAKVGFDALGLSNNHAFDRGPEGLVDSRRHINDAGIATFGAGFLPEAEAPHLIKTPGGIVAVLAFGYPWKAGALATESTSGTIALSPTTIARGKALATAAGAKWVVAFVHWGKNYQPVEKKQQQFAAMFAAADYSLVIGHHPHFAQPVEIVQGMPVLYSLGNFTFATPGRFTGFAPGYGLVARTVFQPSGAIKITLTCIVTDNDVVKFQPIPCSSAEATRLFSTLGSAIRMEGDAGIVEAVR